MPKPSNQVALDKILAIYDHCLDKREIEEIEQLLPHTTVTQRTDHVGRDLPRIYGLEIKDLSFAEWRVYTVSNAHVSPLLALRGEGLLYAGVLNVIREAELEVLLTRYEFVIGCSQAVDEERQTNINHFHCGDETNFAAFEEFEMIHTMIDASYRHVIYGFSKLLKTIRTYP